MYIYHALINALSVLKAGVRSPQDVHVDTTD